MSNQTIKNIVITNSVKEIGVSAFENCTALENIVIPNSLEKINGYTFHNCKALTEIASVNSVRSATYETATLNGKIGDTLTVSFKATPDLIWTLIPDAGTAEHAETLDITLSGDIVDVDFLTFTVTDDGNLTLAPE